MCGRKRVNDGFAFVLIMPAAWTNALQFALENSAGPALRSRSLRCFKSAFMNRGWALTEKSNSESSPRPDKTSSGHPDTKRKGAHRGVAPHQSLARSDGLGGLGLIVR